MGLADFSLQGSWIAGSQQSTLQTLHLWAELKSLAVIQV